MMDGTDHAEGVNLHGLRVEIARTLWRLNGLLERSMENPNCPEFWKFHSTAQTQFFALYEKIVTLDKARRDNEVQPGEIALYLERLENLVQLHSYIQKKATSCRRKNIARACLVIVPVITVCAVAGFLIRHFK